MSEKNNFHHEDGLPADDRWVEYDLSEASIEDSTLTNTDETAEFFPAEDEQLPNEFADSTVETDEKKKNAAHPRYPAGQERFGKREISVPASALDEPDDEDENALKARDYRPIRFRRDGRRGCLGGLMYAVFIISISIILACLGWMAASDLLALNKEPLVATIDLPKSIFSEKEVTVETDGVETVEIYQAADIDYVANALKDGGIIEYPFLFRLYANFADADIKIDPGTYELSTSFDYRALVKKMQAGSESQLQTFITFPEGYTMAQIFQKLEDEEICSAESLYEAAENVEFNFSFLESVTATGAERLEGYLFPDSYYFYEGMSAKSAINKFLNNMHYLITADMLAATEQRGLTWNEVIVIASLIERETSGSDEDRANIACVIYNRLKAGMPLQIDAAVLYDHPEHEGAPTGAMLEQDSPHNTHTRVGLPQTAIANPGLASIQAALKPADKNYLYYALDEETGEHRFFTNFNDHAAFVATQSYAQ